MEGRKNRKKIIAISIISIVVILAIISVVVFVLLNSQKLKLYNTTLELGQENYIEVLTKEDNVYIKEGYTYSVKDNKIDINKVGSYEITFEIKGKGETSEEIKKIQVQDTTPPTINLKKDKFFIGDNINIEEIVEIKDLSQEGEIPYNEAKATVTEQFDTSTEGAKTLEITVEDKNGNKGTQKLAIYVSNPIVNLYDYIEDKIKGSKTYSIGSYDNKFVIKYDYNFGNGITSKGWVNFTDEVHYSYSKVNTGFSIVSTGDLTYFNNEYKVSKVYTSAGLTTGTLAIDKYLKDGNQGFTQAKGDLSSYQSSLDSEISSINDLLNNKNGKISLAGKTIEQLKSETINLREMQ